MNIMLQKWINPLKVPVRTFYIITFMNCSLTSQRSMIWSRVNRGHRQTPWNWRPCWCAESLSSKALQGHQLQPREQHWFQQDKTATCCPAPHCPGPWLRGSTDNTTNKHSWKHRGGTLYLTDSTHTLLPEVRHGCSLPWQTVEPPFYIHWHKSLLFHGALNIIWDQLSDRNCTSLCTWHFL